MKKTILLLLFFIIIPLAIHQEANGISVSATPHASAFGPNDWILVNVDIQGYGGGPISWIAHRPDNSTISGTLYQVTSGGHVVHEIVRDAFDNYFGDWSIDYIYNGVKGTANFKVNPIILSIFTDKDLYFSFDAMRINVTTSYYTPVAAHAQFLHLSFFDKKGNPAKDTTEIDIRAIQPSVVYNFPASKIAKYNPPGLYKLRIQYFNTTKEIPFLIGDISTYMQVSAQTDKDTYKAGEPVNMDILVTRVTQTNGTLSITDPLGYVTKHQFHLESVHNSLVLTDSTKKPGTYRYQVQYAGISKSGLYNVIENPKLPPNIEFEVFLDKLNFRPGEIIHAKIHVSQVVSNMTDLWVIDPNGTQYPKLSLPVTSNYEILPQKIGKSYMTGQWQFYVDYAGIIKNVPFYVIGIPVSNDEILNVDQYSIPLFVSHFGNSTFNSPAGISIDSNDDIYIVDSGNSLVKKFDHDGRLLLSWGASGSGNGQFIHPSGIFVGKKYVYVADTGNARIQMFDKEGNFVYAWGGYGEEHGKFHIPTDVAVDDKENLFVTDSGRSTIQIFDPHALFANEIRPLLTTGANFSSTDGIAFDSSDNFYVSTGEDKVLVFSEVDKFLNFFGSSGNEGGRFNNPTSIAIGSKDYVYIADTNNHRIEKFDQYGNFILTWGTEGNSTGEFEEPVGLAIDSLGNIYVVDKKNNDVQKFALYGTFQHVIPTWSKERALWWSQGVLDKYDFALVVKLMINQGLINNPPTSEPSSTTIPDWMKRTAGWWSEGFIDDQTFTSELQYLISTGIVRV